MSHQRNMPIEATIHATETSQVVWEAVVIGAGPAGSLAARQLALAGVKVLLVDKKAFPREKVCVGCLNARAVGILNQVGLGHLVATSGGVPLHRFYLATGRRRLEIPIRGSWYLAREQLDAALVRAAIASGAQFLPETTAAIQPHCNGDGFRSITLENSGGQIGAVQARVVIAADGLGNSCTSRTNEFDIQVRTPAWVGVGASFSSSDSEFGSGTIFMATTAAGYAGLVRGLDGHLHVAAALDRRMIREAGGPQHAVRHVLAASGWQPNLGDGLNGWQGTPALTRFVTKPAAWRILLIGDAAGYVEPFTGEGIAWALEASTSLTDLVVHGAEVWSDNIQREWCRRYGKLIRARHRLCRHIVGGLRHPLITRGAMFALSRMPRLTKLLAQRILEGSPSAATR
jgi:flavin-dependent dehydrogenase